MAVTWWRPRTLGDESVEGMVGWAWMGKRRSRAGARSAGERATAARDRRPIMHALKTTPAVVIRRKYGCPSVLP
jgi:hypothetical protein